MINALHLTVDHALQFHRDPWRERQPELTDAQKQAVQDATATAQNQVGPGAAGAASDVQKKMPSLPQ
jgi:hypothetical protein